MSQKTLWIIRLMVVGYCVRFDETARGGGDLLQVADLPAYFTACDLCPSQAVRQEALNYLRHGNHAGHTLSCKYDTISNYGFVLLLVYYIILCYTLFILHTHNIIVMLCTIRSRSIQSRSISLRDFKSEIVF